MSLKETFAPDEWAAIAGAPQIVATAVMMATFSGLGGTAKEAFSLAHSLAEGRAGSNPLIQELTTPEEVSAVQTDLRAKVKTLDHATFKQQLNTMAVDDAKRAVEILETKAPDQVAPYKQWLMATAFGVANASKEGDFLGIGGKRISDAERETLNSLSAALDTPVPTA